MRGKQCKSVTHGGRCQGFSGHETPHWFYSMNGHLIQWRTGKIADADWARSYTPPCHASYIHPKDMKGVDFTFAFLPLTKKRKRKP